MQQNGQQLQRLWPWRRVWLQKTWLLKKETQPKVPSLTQLAKNTPGYRPALDIFKHPWSQAQVRSFPFCTLPLSDLI